LDYAQAVTEILRNIKVAAESKRTRDRRISKHLQSPEEYDSKLAAAIFEFQSHKASNCDPSKNCPRAASKSAGFGRIVDWDDVAVTRHGQCFAAAIRHIRDLPAAARWGQQIPGLCRIRPIGQDEYFREVQIHHSSDAAARVQSSSDSSCSICYHGCEVPRFPRPPHQPRIIRHIGDDDCSKTPDLARIASPVVNFRFGNACCGFIGASA